MLHAGLVLEELKKCGVGCVAGLPDNSSAALIALLEKDDSIRYVSVTREGEAFAVVSGFWMGGGEAAVLVQNTGLLESGDSLRGTAQRMRVPLLCLITYRGFAKMPGVKALKQSGGNDRELTAPGTSVKSPLAVAHADIRSKIDRPFDFEPELFSDSGVDSAALVTEATLRAWGVPFDFLRSDADLPKISKAFSQAQTESRPVALLITAEMT